MSDKAVEGKMSVEDFFVALSKYQKRAMGRIGDYLNADRGVPEHEIRTMYEMFIDLDNRVKRLEEMFD